jgi:putative transposase
MSGQYRLTWLCEALLVSRSGYYEWIGRRQNPSPRAEQNRLLRERIRSEFLRSHRTYGSPRITRALGGGVSRKRVARLMREENLRARQRSKYRVRTTDSRHADPIAPNRLREFKSVRPNQAWATDATYLLTSEGWIYIVALIDLFTRRIVGWSMGSSLDAGLAVRALQMAIAQRRPAPDLIVHSDRGMQFASAAFRNVLAQHRLLASMSRKANCYDNADIESFWSSLKYEVVYHQRFATKNEARAAVFAYIEAFYNRTRMHSSLGYLSPAQFESNLN